MVINMEMTSEQYKYAARVLIFAWAMLGVVALSGCVEPNNYSQYQNLQTYHNTNTYYIKDICSNNSTGEIPRIQVSEHEYLEYPNGGCKTDIPIGTDENGERVVWVKIYSNNTIIYS